MTETLQLSPFQEKVLATPEGLDLFLGGGRGGGKSFTLALLALRHAEQHGAKARVLYLRQTFPGLRDFETLTLDLYGRIYGAAARYNSAAKTWRFPNGATLELQQCENQQQLTKFLGRSVTLLLADECGEWASPGILDRMRGNLRSAGGVPVRVVMAANPGGPGHSWLQRRHVSGRVPWMPYSEEHTGAAFATCPSTYEDNPFLDSGEYRRQLEAATATDSELRKAWLRGDWAIARGAFFSTVLDSHRVAVNPWPTRETFPRWWQGAQRGLDLRRYNVVRMERRRVDQPDRWRFFLAMDFGSAAPAVVYVVASSPGDTGPDGRHYPPDSLILIDELATNRPDSLTEGLEWPVPKLSEAILELARRWGIEPAGCADDACFAHHGSSAGSIADEFRRAGVSLSPARKADRVTGWERMRRLLADAGEPDLPGLYVSRSCRYWWQTVPSLPRDPRRSEDLDSRAADHAADATRYAITFEWGASTKVIDLSPVFN